jgi:hypothetical protein
MCRETGCFGSFIRLVLSLINLIFLLFGIALFLSSAFLKWGDLSMLNRAVGDLRQVKTVLDMSTIDFLSIALMILSGTIILISLFGLIGACCANRFFLVVYELVIIVLFLSHGVLLIACGLKSSDVEKEFRNSLNKTVQDLRRFSLDQNIMNNTNNTSLLQQEDLFKSKQQTMFFLSEMFECCGANGLRDFDDNEALLNKCCSVKVNRGCADTIVSEIKANGINIVIIPNSVILCFEFIIILIVPFLIGRITRSKLREFENGEEEDRMQMKPTTYNNSFRE